MRPKVFTENNSGLEYLKKSNNSKKAIILFHGYGASMLDLFGLADVIKNNQNYDWIFPNGHMNLGFGMGMMSRAWFPIDMQALEMAMQQGTHRDFANIYTDEFDLAVSKGEAFLKAFNEEYESIAIGGFSQGAMITSHIALRNSELIKSLLLFSGNLIGQKELVKLLETSHKFPFFQDHGKSDPVLGYDHAKSLFELMKLGGHSGEFISFDGQHEIPQIVINKVGEFLAKYN